MLWQRFCFHLNQKLENQTLHPHMLPHHHVVRLVHPNSRCSGRVEIFHNGQWVAVCDNIWGVTHAQVVWTSGLCQPHKRHILDRAVDQGWTMFRKWVINNTLCTSRVWIPIMERMLASSVIVNMYILQSSKFLVGKYWHNTMITT